MARWVLLNAAGNAGELAPKFHVHPFIINLLANRNIKSEKEVAEFLSDDISIGNAYEGLPNMDSALSILSQIRDEEIPVRIIGDYDVDGVLATIILIKGLKAFGIEADYAIPHRIIDGYGMNERLIEEAYKDGIKALITCDNGIRAWDEIAHAKELGMRVIVTDHHEVPKENGEDVLPPADAVIDPKMQENTYPMRDICGAQVAYKMISALLGFDRENVSGEQKELQEELMMFSGLAALEDVMPLVSENHRIVRWAISKVKESKNKGIRALIAAKELTGVELKSYHIGFLLGPCINASGRLDSAEQAVELFRSDSDSFTKEAAEEIVRLNEIRKEMTAEAEELAIRKIEESGRRDKVIVLYLPEVHESIAGIVAGRIRERYNRPTFVLTDSTDGIKGSGRSVEAYDMNEELSAHGELLHKFGGHKMAAGLTLKEGCLEEFRRVMNEACSLTEEDFEQKVRIDAEIPFSDFTIDFIEQMELLEPFGPGCEGPLFAMRNAFIRTIGRFGRNNEFLSLRIIQNSRTYTMKAFGNAIRLEELLKEKFGVDSIEEFNQMGGGRVNLAFTPVINEFREERRTEFRLQHCK